MTAHAPSRRVAHQVPPRRGDSIRGIVWAAHHHYPWADVNTLLSADGVAVAAHGAPYGLAQQGFLPHGDDRSVRDLTMAELRVLHSPDGYGIQRMRHIYMAAAHQDVRIETEAKADHRFTKVHTWQALAEDAASAWGPNRWSSHVVAKVLTDHHDVGGLAFAEAVCEAAWKAGWPTMILPRGADVHRVIRAPWITYNRGGRIH